MFGKKGVDLIKVAESTIKEGEKYTDSTSELIIDNSSVVLDNVNLCENPIYKIEEMTTYGYLASIKKAEPNTRVGILNFASATRVGGGFMTGSKAQEESLCYVSNLYHTLLEHKNNFYNFHRGRNDGFYSNRLIVSRDVKFFKDEEYAMLEKPINCDVVVTSPAVNCNALKLSGDERKVKEVMESRIEAIIKQFAIEKVDVIVLGAFGCGVFGNSPLVIVSSFKKVLEDKGYGKYFKKIVFAIPSSKRDNNLSVFKGAIK